MKTKELNKKKIPIVKISKKLEKYKSKTIFQEKLNKANEVLEKVGLPEK